MSETDHNDEEWRSVIGHEGWYSVSNFGRVRRDCGAPGARIGRMLGQRLNSEGYARVCLQRNGSKQERRVHCLVMAAFLGPPPAGMNVNHKNGKKNDNCLSNLEYTSVLQNVRHSIDVLGRSTWARGENHYCAKLNEKKVLELRRLRAQGWTHRAIAGKLGVTESTIRKVIRRGSWKHLP